MYFHFLFCISFPTVHDIFCFSTNPGGSLQIFSKGVQHVMKKWNKLDLVQMKSKRSNNEKMEPLSPNEDLDMETLL